MTRASNPTVHTAPSTNTGGYAGWISSVGSALPDGSTGVSLRLLSRLSSHRRPLPPTMPLLQPGPCTVRVTAPVAVSITMSLPVLSSRNSEPGGPLIGAVILQSSSLVGVVGDGVVGDGAFGAPALFASPFLHAATATTISTMRFMSRTGSTRDATIARASSRPVASSHRRAAAVPGRPGTYQVTARSGPGTR